MGKYKRITFYLVVLQIVLFFIVIVFFHVDNMTLGQGDVSSFDTGWTLSYPNGENVQIDTLPYHSECKAGEVLVMEKKVPRQYYGKTMFFLSADKELVIRMDGEEIYSSERMIRGCLAIHQVVYLIL